MKPAAFFKVQSLQAKAIMVSIFMLAALLFLGKTSMDVSDVFQASKHIDQLNSSLRKQLILNRIASHLGYGGAIHQFKDYEIRRRDSYHARALGELAAVKTLLHAYQNIGAISSQENEQLQLLRQLDELMTSSLRPMKQMIKERISSGEIDTQLAIDVQPYRQALDTLFGLLKQQQMEYLQTLTQVMPQLAGRFSVIEADIRSMGEIYLGMGFGGIIHVFKNYLLHPQASIDMGAYRQEINQLTESLARLAHSGHEPVNTQHTVRFDEVRPETTEIESTEMQAHEQQQQIVQELASLPAAYQQAMQQAQGLYRAGKPLSVTARKSRVKADKQYMHNLDALNQILVQQYLFQQQQSHTYLEAIVWHSQQQLLISIVVLLSCILLAIFLFAIQMPRLMSKSIAAVAMVTGHHGTQLHSLASRRDEFGLLARAIEQSGAVLVEQEQERQQQLEVERLAIENRQRQERVSQRNQMADDFEATLGQIIAGIAQQVEFARQCAVEVASKSEQLMQQSSDVREDSRQGIVLVESTEHASTNLHGAIMDMGGKTAHASDIANQAMNDTKEINAMVKRLDDVSRRVESVIKGISNVAVNTRVLAMNATIEAASAGEAGKGFAVVAQEVKELAVESSQAVKNIAEEMAYMQQEIVATADILQNTADKINHIHESTQTVAASVRTQVQSIELMSKDAHAASSSMQGVIEIMRILSVSASESELASNKLRGAIEHVHEKTDDANVQLHQFLDNIRA
ncbi:MAG: methyl-accepting chemotaxis protein [Mariprofundus sp.]|nr:methyl-accepting chemotaxis protein [Mariprofundus sp.]